MAEVDRRIKPGDLRSECLKCGGDGRAWVNVPQQMYDPTTGVPAGTYMVRKFKGQCVPCSGTGKVFPRKIDI